MGYVAWEKNFSSLQIRSSYEIKLKYFKVLLFTSLFKKKFCISVQVMTRFNNSNSSNVLLLNRLPEKVTFLEPICFIKCLTSFIA